MSLIPTLIAPFETGLDTSISPWILPNDALVSTKNCHIKHGAIEKRSGLQLFATLSQGLRVMGIGRYIAADGSKKTLAWDTTRAYRYNTATLSFDIMDAAAIMSSSETDYIWFVNWQASGGLNRLYFTNGKAYDGVSVDGIRYYDDAGGLVTNLFTPNLNTGGTRILWGSKLVFTLKQRLIVLHTFERDTGTGTTTTYPQRARWCKAQNPSTWDDTIAGGGGFVDAPTGDQIVSARALQDRIIVFFTNSVWALVPLSDPALPFRWIKINNFRSCDGKMASVSYDRFSGSLGSRGIFATDSNQATRIDDRIESFTNDEINFDQFGKVFCERDYQNKRWWTLYTTKNATENNAALIYDDDSKSFTTYEISLNCLGYGNQSQDFTLDDFTGDYDFAIEDMSDETLFSYYYQDNEEIFLGGDTSGNIYLLNSQGDDNGTAIDFEIKTASWNPYQKEGAEIQMSYIDIYVDTQLTTRATVEFFKNGSFSPYGSQNINFLPNLGFIATVSAITQANPANVTAVSHGLSTGDIVYLYNVEGMTEVNGIQYAVTVADENNFTLNGVDSSAFSAYTVGGGVYRKAFYNDRVWKRVFAGGIGNEHSIRITSTGIDTPIIIHALKPYFKARAKREIN